MPNSVFIYPGTFDPITLGHVDIARRAADLCESLIVAVAEAHHKRTVFSVPERVDMVKKALAELPNVQVMSFGGLLVDFARKVGARAVVRGLRAVSDFEYEFQMAWMNRRLCPMLETVFLMPSEEYAFLSSSLVKEIAALGGDVSSMVPPCVAKRLVEALRGETGSIGG